MQQVVFLDRDGTLNVDAGYIVDPGQIELIPGAANALSEIRGAGYSLVVVSNQSAIGRGMGTAADVQACNDELSRQLLNADSNAKIDHFLFCPHAPEDNCECRKPKPGLLKQLPSSFAVDFDRSWMVGDKLSDLGFGEQAGIPEMHRILVLTGYGKDSERKLSHQVVSATDVTQAAKIICSN